MYTDFEWPLPASFELAPGESLASHEAAVLGLSKGTKLNGTLSRFLPAHGVLEFLPTHGRVNLDIPLADIEQLRLTRALRLRPRQSALAGAEAGLAPAAQHQPFHVVLASGEALEGTTAGFELRPAGLFLYPVSYGDTVTRVFVPAASIREQGIGKPLGEMLVKERLLTAEQVDAGLRRQHALRDRKLGEILVEEHVVSQEGLHAALERQRAMPIRRLGEALLDAHAVTPEQLDQALERQKADRKKPLGEILVEMGFLERRELLRMLSQKLGIPWVDLARFSLDPAVLKLVPAALAREHRLVPLCRDGAALVVAMENPLDPAPLEALRFATRGAVIPVMAGPEDIDQALRTHFAPGGADGPIEALATRLSSEAPDAAGADEEHVQESDSALVRLVNKMIVDAHAGGVSDIHVETNPGRRKVSVRFRKDGALYEYLQLPHQFRRAIVSRLKIMAGLDIAERRRGQDGRINFAQFGPANVELRLATIPTLDGLEDAVLRVLAAGEPLPLTKLGLAEPLLERARELLGRAHGLLLVCGPTGSGKTTTLHSLLGVLNAPERKIWTAEDPIEISQAGVRQVQVNARIGWTFAAALRSFLRADPDVVMIGEMRDAETATIAIEASLTGHLVLSTLHTNSAPETVVRLLEMGMDPFSFGDALAGVLAQRLARRLCPACKSARNLGEREVGELAAEYCQDVPLAAEEVVAGWRRRHGAVLRLHEAAGCDQCKRTGYRGRMGLHELMLVGPAQRQLIQRRAPAAELRAAAAAEGMRTLKQDGIDKCLAGLTDLHEVRAAAS